MPLGLAVPGVSNTAPGTGTARIGASETGKTSLGAQCHRPNRSTKYHCAIPSNGASVEALECTFREPPHAGLQSMHIAGSEPEPPWV